MGKSRNMDMQSLSFAKPKIIACREDNKDLVVSGREFVNNPGLGCAVLNRAVIQSVLDVSFIDFWLTLGLCRIHEPHSSGLNFDYRSAFLRILLSVDQLGI
jgi:hypothetical protein